MNIDALGAASVLDPQGRTHRVGNLWRDRPVLLNWLRHFGCVFCREQAVELASHQEEFDAAGVRLVFIGNGTPRAAGWFQQRYVPDHDVFTDPGLVTYRAIGAHSGVLSTLGPRSVAAGVTAYTHGYRQGRVAGHPFQQGGMVLIEPGSHLIFEHLSSYAGDHPPLEDVLVAVRAAAPTELRGGAARRAVHSR